jgi:superfamily II DNA or RNA helicase
MTLELRPYQVDSIARARELMRGGVRRLLIAAPTGAGKTVIGADII